MKAFEDWRTEEDGWVLGGCVEYKLGYDVTDFNSLVDAVQKLIEGAHEEPEKALGLLACLVYHLGDLLVHVKADLAELKKRYGKHKHVDAVVVQD